MKVEIKLENASQMPRRYFGLHMVEGVAEYKHLSKPNDPYRILASEQAIKDMDKTFDGLPVYVNHVDDVNVLTVERDADGFVSKSFFNKSDGKHWCEFLVTTDRGHEAIQKGWKLSNAYVVKQSREGGEWHGVPYKQELLAGVYDHLAIVQNPRYAESIILTPDQFREYNAKKEAELDKRLTNSIEEKKSMYNWFKKAKVENSAELEGMTVTLPKSGVEVDVKSLIEKMDEMTLQNGKGRMCNDDDQVQMDNESMSVADLKNGFKKMKKNQEDAEKKELENKKKNEEEAEEKKKKEFENKKKNEEDEEKRKNSLEEAAKKLANSGDNFAPEHKILETSVTQIARGQERY